MKSLHGRTLLFFIFLAGLLADFVLVGIFKVIWFAIYGTTYFALAMTIETYVARSHWAPYSRKAAVIFLVGALLGHLIFVGHARRDLYAMTTLSTEPLVLQTPDFQEFLYLTGDAVQHAIVEKGLKDGIPMWTETTRDYGCLKTFKIESVAGVDVRHDPGTTWTLRIQKLGVFQNLSQPTKEEDLLPWCKIQFYRM